MAQIELATLNPAETPTPRVVAIPPVVATRRAMRIEEHESWPVFSGLKMAMTAGVTVKGFKIRDLLRLEPGQVIESSCPETEDVPLKVGQVQVAWSEFEVVDQHLVVRLTRLA
jgi:flagellar motor switch/type III secretory pathway protein FliN